MIPIISETFGFFIGYKEKECNLSVCTLEDVMTWVALSLVLPASGGSSL